MHVVVVGPGALGSLLAVQLAPQLKVAGGTLHLLDHNQKRAAELMRSGITLLKFGRQFTAHPAVTADPAKISACDILLLCVKSGNVTKALHHAGSLITEKTLVVGLQNGMAHIETLRQSKGIAVAAVSSTGATLATPGQVLFGGAGVTLFGLLSNSRESSKRLKRLVSLFNLAGLEALLVPDIRPRLWEKLFVNVAINPLTAIHKRKNGQLLTSCSIRNIMKMAVSEAKTVAEANRIHVIGDPLALAFTICRRTKNNTSSMLQDVLKKRPTEIDAINGYIVSEGKRLNIDTPVNADLVHQIRIIERSWQAAA